MEQPKRYVRWTPNGWEYVATKDDAHGTLRALYTPGAPRNELRLQYEQIAPIPQEVLIAFVERQAPPYDEQ